MPDPTRPSSRLRGLYAITDEKLIPEAQFRLAIEQALQGGTGIIQYRDKSGNYEKQKDQASLLRTLCDQHSALLLINDDLELARLVNADGIHLGENDASISAARELLGEHAIIGASCYNQIELAIEAEREGADYIAFGAFFSSPTKPSARPASAELLAEAKQRTNLPVCAIGGITIDNAAPLIQNGADMIAIISGIFAQTDTKQASQDLANLF